MGIEGMLHCVSGAMFSMSQVPEKLQHLEGYVTQKRRNKCSAQPNQHTTHLASHDALLVILSKVPDEIQQFISLLLPCPYPAALKTTKQVVKLFWQEVPCQLDQQVMNVLDNGLMFAILAGPNAIQILQCEYFLLDAESNQTIQLLNILRVRTNQVYVCASLRNALLVTLYMYNKPCHMH